MNNKISEISKNEISSFDKINKALEKEKFDEVIELSKKAIKKFPKQVLFYTVHSIGYSQKGNTDEALIILSDALKIFPGNYEILYQTAKVFEDTEQYDKAEEYFNKSFKATPENNHEAKSDCMNELGVIMFNQGKETKAIKYWEKALELNPDNSNAKLNLYENLLDEEDEDFNEYDLLEEDFELFEYVQMRIYLAEHNRKKFKSEEEEINVKSHIYAYWTNSIVGQIDTLESLDEDQKAMWFNSIVIDFSGPVPEIIMPVIDNPYYKEMSKKLSFLPANGISFIMLAYPFLNAVGISMDDIEDILDEDEISAEDTEKYKWAYEIGERFYKLSDSKSELEFEKRHNEIIKIASQKLSKKKAEKVFMITMNGMIEGKLPEGIE